MQASSSSSSSSSSSYHSAPPSSDIRNVSLCSVCGNDTSTTNLLSFQCTNPVCRRRCHTMSSCLRMRILRSQASSMLWSCSIPCYSESTVYRTHSHVVNPTTTVYIGCITTASDVVGYANSESYKKRILERDQKNSGSAPGADWSHWTCLFCERQCTNPYHDAYRCTNAECASPFVHKACMANVPGSANIPQSSKHWFCSSGCLSVAVDGRPPERKRRRTGSSRASSSTLQRNRPSSSSSFSNLATPRMLPASSRARRVSPFTPARLQRGAELPTDDRDLDPNTFVESENKNATPPGSGQSQDTAIDLADLSLFVTRPFQPRQHYTKVDLDSFAGFDAISIIHVDDVDQDIVCRPFRDVHFPPSFSCISVPSHFFFFN